MIPAANGSRLNVQRGDLVSFVLRINKQYITRYAVKRIHALEDDVVEMLDEKRYIVLKGCCWVLGDNAKDSFDSRHFGAVPLSNIRGKVIMSFHDEPHHFAYHLTEDRKPTTNST
jgi:type IV secretory pathway protease TraF